MVNFENPSHIHNCLYIVNRRCECFLKEGTIQFN